MKKILCVFFSFCPLLVLCQIKELNLQLNFHEGSGPFEYLNFPIRWNDTSIAFKNTYPEFRGIPQNLKNIKRGIICFDRDQYVYQNFINGKIDKERFNKIKDQSMSPFNEKELVKRTIKCYVSLISATNELNENICIIDQNNNYDFSDDKPFLIPRDDTISEENFDKYLKKIDCERVLNGRVIKDTVPILIVKSGSFLKFSVAQYATATLKSKNKNYKLAVCPLYFYGRTWKQTEMVLLTDSLKRKKAALNLIVNDDGFITIGNKTYQYKGVEIDKNLLSLQKVSSSHEFSAQIGFHAPLFTDNNLSTGKDISLQSFRGKYVLIDFWGTWCKPCRAQLPNLVELNNSVDTSRFVLISIASHDYLDSLKKVIAKEKMNWPQILSDKITSDYHVSAFPTNLLINPSGVVMAKNLSMDDLKQKLSSLALLVN